MDAKCAEGALSKGEPSIGHQTCARGKNNFLGVLAFAACCIEFVIACPGHTIAAMSISAQAHVA